MNTVMLFSDNLQLKICACDRLLVCYSNHGVQGRMISVDIFFVFLRLLFFAVVLLYVT